jgi:hypothetical protein
VAKYAPPVVRRALLAVPFAILALLLVPRFHRLGRAPLRFAVERIAPPLDRVTAIGDGSESRDGGLATERFVATSAGLRLFGDDGRHLRTLDRALGMPSHDLVAAVAWGDRIVAAARDGSLVLAGPRGDEVHHLAAEITDLAVLGDAVLVATADRGLLRWTGGELAEQLEIPADVAIVTLVVGERGVAAATARGEIWLVPAHDDPRRLLSAPDDVPVTLAWEGPDLLIGRGDRIERLDAAGRLVRLRSDLGAVSLAARNGWIFAARAEGGVVVFRPGHGGERSTLSEIPVHRLRAVDGAVLAFGRGGAWRLDGDGIADRWVAEVPSVLAVPRVAALLVEKGELWVGNERGLDILDANGARHVPLPPVRALVASPDTREVIALTASGHLRIDRLGRVHRDLGPAPTLDATPRLTLPEGLVVGDATGLSLTDPLSWRARRLRTPIGLGRVTALARQGDDLWVGTDEGLIRLPLAPLLAVPPQS